MSEPNAALVRMTEDDVLKVLREAQLSLAGLYASINQQLSMVTTKVAGAGALLDNPLVSEAFPAENAWRQEVAKFNAALAGFASLMDTVPPAPRIGE
jgi:hypothetical protein